VPTAARFLDILDVGHLLIVDSSSFSNLNSSTHIWHQVLAQSYPKFGCGVALIRDDGWTKVVPLVVKLCKDVVLGTDLHIHTMTELEKLDKAVTICKQSGGAHVSLVVANLKFEDGEDDPDVDPLDDYTLDFKSTPMVIDCPGLRSMVDPKESRSLSVQIGFHGKNLYVRTDVEYNESEDMGDLDDFDIDVNLVSATPGFILDCRRGCVTVDGAWYVQKFGICNPPYQATGTGSLCPDMLCVLGVNDLRNTSPVFLSFSNSLNLDYKR